MSDAPELSAYPSFDGPATSLPPLRERVRIREERLLSDHWYVLKATTFDYLRRDGSWQTQQRETYDRGNGAVVLLVDRARAVVRLTKQFRYPVFVNGWQELLLEAPAGLLDESGPEQRIRQEAEEEAGVRIREIRPIFEAYMSPGSVTEKLHFFVADFEASDVVGAGGGLREEGEDIETVELPFEEAMRRVDAGEIVDAKTLLLLRWAREQLFPQTPGAPQVASQTSAADQPQSADVPMLILVAGPYRSGTDDDPVRIEQNVAAMTEAALRVAERGHVPMLGEWLALPLLRAAGSTELGDAVFDRYFHTTARVLVAHCDGCLRIGGPSAGADEMVGLARSLGLPIYLGIDQVPPLATSQPNAISLGASRPA